MGHYPNDPIKQKFCQTCNKPTAHIRQVQQAINEVLGIVVCTCGLGILLLPFILPFLQTVKWTCQTCGMKRGS